MDEIVVSVFGTGRVRPGEPVYVFAEQVGRGYVVLPGGTGTLLEMAMVWELKNKRFLDQGKPVILAGEFWRPLVDLVAGDDPACAKAVAFAETPGEVAESIGRGLRS